MDTPERDNPETRGDSFLSSLNSITANDIKPAEVTPPKRRIASGLIRIGVIIVCIAVFIYSVTLLIRRVGEYTKSEDLYGLLADIWYTDDYNGSNPYGNVEYSLKDGSAAATLDYASSQNAVEESVSDVVVRNDSDLLVYIKSKMNALKKQNADAVGWITIDNTNIDYPIAYGRDNDYYINHAFDGSYSFAGTIFIDYRDEPNFDDNYNTVLYGHNLLSGKMFSQLDKFFTKSFFKKNRYIYIYNPNGMYVYQTFCVTKIDISINYTRVFFAMPDDFIEFAYGMKARSVFSTDTTFNGNDRILTLSTCTNGSNSAERYCIMAKLVEIRR